MDIHNTTTITAVRASLTLESNAKYTFLQKNPWNNSQRRERIIDLSICSKEKILMPSESLILSIIPWNTSKYTFIIDSLINKDYTNRRGNLKIFHFVPSKKEIILRVLMGDKNIDFPLETLLNILLQGPITC